ncbi:MAG: DUF4954 domain-containing protein [Spirochaetaceae bacterium 4572_59]|nr:MAG: DUF4954 domain-containing protein [Spirochaetaceae bacterium 4572_59]
MNKIEKRPLKLIGYDFIEKEFIPEGKDEYYLRNKQVKNWKSFRQLTANEIEVLVKNDNSADNWNDIYVTDHFNPKLVKNNQFHGLIRIGDLENLCLEFHDIRQPVGIYNSNIISCDIGSNVSISNVNILSHYIIRDEVILQNIHEMVTTNYSKFGNGVIKEGEEDSIRVWIEVSNENGGRSIVPFNNMLTGDAWLWSRYRDRKKLMDSFLQMTQNEESRLRGYYGTIGTRCVIKHCRILKDVHVGSDAYIKGSNKLKNLTINSNAESHTQIGEGVELVNGIVGFGCRIFYGCKAVRFIMDDYTNLKYGARLINSFLGSNSTISCCEVLNALIFPGHEQHHNSSFLCASTIYGQSNMASGATIGSNHNSRGSDGEIIAGRGFWPGLCTSLKHNCIFSSFNLLVKGSYPSEINNPLPFSLIANSEEGLTIIPAYWFNYNMYALARNSWKYKDRDKRLDKKQHIEFDYLAPDTVNEMLSAMKLLRQWAENSQGFIKSEYSDPHDYLMNSELSEIYADHIESGKRRVKIVKPSRAYRSYIEMIYYYAVRSVIKHFQHSGNNLSEIAKMATGLKGSRSHWLNVGGQLIQEEKVLSLLNRIESKKIKDWQSVHSFYKEQEVLYYQEQLHHALKSLKEVLNLSGEDSTEIDWNGLIQKGIGIQNEIALKTKQSREKDYSNDFRNMTFSNLKERDAVIGKLENNGFIKYINKETELFKETALSLIM